MGILEEITAERALDARRRKKERPASSLGREASPARPIPGIQAETQGFIIAECKRASPSRGLLVPDYDPVRLARAYEGGGAGLVSVLTEPRHFLGQDAHLSAVRAAVGLPVLRKDFIVDPYQIDEAWSIGADVILLIADALDARQLKDFGALAHERGLSVLVEIRESVQVAAALEARPEALGVNSRDLRDFSLHPDKSRNLAGELARQLPGKTVLVAESGIRTAQDIRGLRDSGYRAFLVGESLATAGDPRETTLRFTSAARGDFPEREEA